MRYLVYLLISFTLITGAMYGQTWTSLNGPPSLTNIESIAIDSTGNTIYMADSITILKSTNAGTSWEPKGTLTNVQAVACIPNNPNIMLAGSSTLFRRSTDGGSSWQDTITGTRKPSVIATSYIPQNSSKVYVGGLQGDAGNVICYSGNSGVTFTGWVPSPSVDISLYDIAMYPKYNADTKRRNLAVAVGYRSNGKSVWFNADPNNSYNTDTTKWFRSTATEAYQFISITIQDTGAGYKLYAGTTNGRVYKSIGVNQPWYQTTALPGIGTSEEIRSVKADTSGHLYVLSENHLYVSTNGGSNWTTIESGIVDVNLKTLAVSPNNNSIVFAGAGSFLYKTTNAGTLWTPVTSYGTGKFSVNSTVASSGSAVSVLSNTTATSKFDGTNWTFSRIGVSGDDFKPKSIFYNYRNVSNPYMYLLGNLNNIEAMFKSTDNGATFSQFGYSTTANCVATIYSGMISSPSDPGRLYTFGKLKQVTGPSSTALRNWFYSSDNGETWDASKPSICTTSDTVNVGAMTGNDRDWWAGLSGNDGVYRVEADASPHKINNSPQKNIYTIAINTNFNNVAYVGTSYSSGTGGLYVSTNATADTNVISFTNVYTSVAVKKALIDPRYIFSLDSSRYVFMVTAGNEIYRSTNRGSSWTNVTGGALSGVVINDLQTDPNDTNKLYIATSNGVYRAQLAGRPTGLNPNTSSTVLACDSTTLTWNVVTGATSYHVEISTSPSFSPIFDSATTTNSFYAISDTLVGGVTYYWRVYSTNEFGRSPYGYTSFTTDLQAPVTTTPANGTTNIINCNSLMLIWNAPPCETGSYNIQVARDTNFTSHLETYTSGLTFVEINSLLCGITYYWRVQVNPGGPWSSIKYFSTIPCTTASPIIKTPPDNVLNMTRFDPVQFNADTVVAATGYRLQIATDNLFNSVFLNRVNASSNASFTIDTTLSASTEFYWHIIAYNNCTKANGTSATYSFTTSPVTAQAPSAVDTLIYPLNNSTNVNTFPITFDWSCADSSNVVKYQIQISTSSTFTTINFQDTIYNGATKYTISIMESGIHYYWRVRGVNENDSTNNYGTWSATWSFTQVSAGKTALQPINQDEVKEKPHQYMLFQNYPNPFNPVTQISFAIPEEQYVTLKVYDVLGKEVAILVDGYQSAGYKSVTFDAGYLPSGIYFYRLQAGNYFELKKLLLAK